MNTLQFSLVLLGMGTFMGIIAFASIYGIASMLGIGEDVVDVRLTFSFFVISCILVYGMSFGVFAGVQKDSCGEVRNWKQLALNAVFPLAFQAVLLTVVIFVPWFQDIVGNLFPPDVPAFGKAAAAFAYYSFWATMMGGALGGTLSGSCKEEPKPAPPLAFKQRAGPIEGIGEIPMPTEESANAVTEGFESERHVRFNLPPE